MPRLFAFLVLLAVDACTGQLASLRLVQVLYRHGDRSPGESIPTDQFQESYWLNGYDQLTPKGMRETFELGKYLRNRYDGFLSRTYLLKELVVRSSDADRALMSAQCVLAGMYPPQGQQRWNQELLWQPIPIHTVPTSNDPLLKVGSYECTMLENRLKSDTAREFANLDRQYAGLLQFLQGVTGYPKVTAEDIGDVHGPLNVERENNLPWPAWMNETLWQQMVELKRIVRYLEFDDAIEQRLSGGYLANDIYQRMVAKVAGKLPDLKMQMYSAHDSTLIALMSALKVANYLLPPYATCFIAELHELLPNDFRVALYLRNTTTVEPFMLQVPGCSNLLCPINEFNQAVRSNLIADIATLEKDCGVKKTKKDCASESFCIMCSSSQLYVFFAFLLILYRQQFEV